MLESAVVENPFVQLLPMQLQGFWDGQCVRFLLVPDLTGAANQC